MKVTFGVMFAFKNTACLDNSKKYCGSVLYCSDAPYLTVKILTKALFCIPSPQLRPRRHRKQLHCNRKGMARRYPCRGPDHASGFSWWQPGKLRLGHLEICSRTTFQHLWGAIIRWAAILKQKLWCSEVRIFVVQLERFTTRPICIKIWTNIVSNLD